MFKQPRFVCPHPECGAFAQQTWVTPLRSREQHDVLQLADIPHADFQDRIRWHAAKCGSCDEMSLWLDGNMVYPHRSRLGEPPHPALPAEVLELYNEAAEVAPRSRRAGAALARAALDKLLRHVDPGASGSMNLKDRIDRLHGKVSSELGRLLHVVRLTANGVVHVDDQPLELVVLFLDDEEGPALFELMLDTVNQLADERIARPEMLRDVFAKLPAPLREKYALEQ
ncbi:hypothetical protein BS329_09675 [Amycolatopsis coloradensis]|uniref:Uncharacterized protein n=1 Tax=Amycolatopsis coloradensis TaxID=76021 RepID=A0A1R0KVQ4_9PSEU|nr:DUF4145 domain-containing protein [Amycolatopsis coloradensis]OLZ53094.1 hypothetical protein BS329_09675 [Amycolatopsis coloradensis]